MKDALRDKQRWRSPNCYQELTSQATKVSKHAHCPHSKVDHRYWTRSWLNDLSPSHPLWTVPTSLPRSQPFLVLLPMQDKTEEFFMQRMRTPSAARSDSPPSGLSRIRASPASLALLPFLISGPDLGAWPSLVQTLGRGHLWSRPWGMTISGPDIRAWPNCWVSVEFLHAPIPRKGSGSNTMVTKLRNSNVNLWHAAYFWYILCFVAFCIFLCNKLALLFDSLSYFNKLSKSTSKAIGSTTQSISKVAIMSVIVKTQSV